jgi:hypothetical protein
MLKFCSDYARKSLDKQEVVLREPSSIQKGNQILDGKMDDIANSTQSLGVSVLAFVTSKLHYEN